MPPAPGQRASVRTVVTGADTALAAGTGDVPVLATPRLLALAEAASLAAVASQLDPGTTTVGTAASLEHRRASPVGTEVDIEAELTEVEGRRLMFSFVARMPGTAAEPGVPGPVPGDDAGGHEAQEDRVVGAGTLERVIVDRAKFLARAGEPPRS
jgi:predicted thioesterase